MTGTLYPSFSFSWPSTSHKKITLPSTQSKPLLKITATIECRNIQSVRFSVSVNHMGLFSVIPVFIMFLFPDKQSNLTNILKPTSKILCKCSYFVHVLFEASVDTVTLRYGALEFIKLFGVHIKLRRKSEKDIIQFVHLEKQKNKSILLMMPCHCTWIFISFSCSFMTFTFVLYSAACFSSCGI